MGLAWQLSGLCHGHCHDNISVAEIGEERHESNLKNSKEYMQFYEKIIS